MPKSWILRTGFWALAVLGLSVMAAAGLVFYARHKFNPSPPSSDFPATADPLTAQQQDIEQFSRLLAIDRAFSPAARAQAARQIAELNSERTPLDGDSFRVTLMRITALADNGHTELYDKDGSRNCLPLRVTLFADGLYVLRARSAYADLLGAQVEKIEGTSTRDVIASLEQLHGGTPGRRRTRAAIDVQSPGILYGAGLGSRADQTTWTFWLPDGSETTRVLGCENAGESEPHGEMTRWLSPEKMPDEQSDWHSRLSADADLPLPLRDFNDAFRHVWINHGCALFIQLKAIQNVDRQIIGDFLKSTTDEMRRRHPCNVILDVRFNGGGDYTKAASFASHLPDFVAPGGRIYILTGPQTFSAAITTVGFVKQAAGSRAIILGEPVGDRLRFYGEGNVGCLPHAPLCVHYATGMHDYAQPCDDWNNCFWLNWMFPVRVRSLAPDELIRMTYADYAARRDAVFDRALMLAAAPRRQA